jgi:TetR/AcrR family transcriptional regulator, cholesterol catabolism regulator
MSSGIGRRRAAALAEGSAGYIERRSEIVVAAAQIFRDKGFSGTSLADVAEALNTDRASLYYYVGSKEELFHEIVREAAEANAAQAEAIRDSASPASDKIAALITALMASYANHPYLFVYIQEDLSKVADGRSSWARQMRAINKRYDDAVQTIVQSGMDDGSIRAVTSARVVANGIIGMMNWTHRWYRASDSSLPSPDEIGSAFADIVLAGLQAKRGPSKRAARTT